MIKKYILLTTGIISLVLGMIGIILPLLPTTPFLLLAAACFINSSPRLYKRLMDNEIFGKYIRNYRENRGIPLRAKITSLSLLWVSVSYSILFILESIATRLLLVIILLGVTIHILRMKTLVDNNGGDSDNVSKDGGEAKGESDKKSKSVESENLDQNDISDGRNNRDGSHISNQ